ncbi:hypothetical protein D3C74_409880 [compost metagenome]
MGNLLVYLESYPASDHFFGQLIGIGAGSLHSINNLAPADDGNPVGNLHDFFQLMCNQNDGLALCNEPLHYRHEFRNFLWRKHSGRLVEY